MVRFEPLPYCRQQNSKRHKPDDVADNKVQHHPYAVFVIGSNKVGEKGQVYRKVYRVGLAAEDGEAQECDKVECQQ